MAEKNIIYIDTSNIIIIFLYVYYQGKEDRCNYILKA